MAIAAKHSMMLPDGPSNTLAVVNDSDAGFVIDFILGDYMDIECCFRIPSDVPNTGNVLVGYAQKTSGNDENDFRLFTYSENTAILDAGVYRTGIDFTRDKWNTVRGPVDGKVWRDGEPVGGEYSVSGNFYSKGAPMGIFTDPTYMMNETPSGFQQGAIRYVTVRQSGTGEVLLNLLPHRKGGFFDTVSKRLFLPAHGSVKIVDWRTL